MKKILIISLSLCLIIGAAIYWTNTPNCYLIKGRSELASGKAAKAFITLEKALKKFPENPVISFELAKAYLACQETKLANDLVLDKKLLDSLKTNSEFHGFLIDLGEANNRSNDKKRARFFANKYLELHNKDEISKKKAREYIILGEILEEKSVEIWEEAYNIAYTLKAKELKSTIKALLLPKYLQEVEQLKEEKKFNEAIAVLRKATILGKNAHVLYAKAVINNELGNIDLAKKQFEEAIQLNPENDNYKIAYANVLEKAAQETNDYTKRKEFSEKAKLLLRSAKDTQKKASLLSKIINFNAKYKVTDGKLETITVGEFSYPRLAFKIRPVSDVILQSYKVIFLSENNLFDQYESPITTDDLNTTLEVTSRNPVIDKPVNAQLFINNELVQEYSNKLN